MHIASRKSDDVTIMDFVGNIKTNEDYNDFKNAINEAIGEGKQKLLLNFQEIHFINSSGLGRLILAAKQTRENGGSLKVAHLSSDLRELFSFTKLDSKIPLYQTEEDALKDF